MKSILIVIGSILLPCLLWATGEPSTYFNIFVPPNNDPVQRNVCLVITAIYDGTTFEIIDDDMDGDSDDSRSGVLYAGQSYVLYLKDNGINDDARYASGGVWKQDGDYFIIRASKLVYASQSTDSDWQHDWLPSISKSSLGTKFILYTPKKTSSNRDLNVFAYQPNTVLTIRRISWANSLLTGLTHVNLDTQQVVTQVTLNPGEDIIYKNTHGRDLLISGETYVIETNKPVTVQYGALYGNERDGGGYVPTSNGSSSGELMYFAVPYQSLGEQEIRIVSWSNDNAVQLDRYSNGTWVPVKSWNLQQRRFAEWVGKSNGNVSYPTVFRLTCSAGKKVSVFEGNWFETGSPGTSDMATMVSSENGTSSGTYFLTYLAPPGNQQNVRNPFTGSLFGQALTHVFLFSQDTAQVTVRDAYTQGAKINRTYTILPNRYVDCYLNLNEWKSIYNGTGTAVGPERPYLEVFSDNPISVMNTNFNDNWMMYFGSSQEQRLKAEISSSVSQIAPGQTCQVVSKVTNESAREGTIVQVSLQVAGGFDVISSTLSTSASTELYEGTPVPGADATIVEYDYSGTVRAQEEIQITTTLLAKPISNQGTLLPNNSTQTLEVQVTAQYNGLLEQSVASQGISLLSGNLSSYQFQPLVNSTLEQHLSNSWSASWVDLDGDGWEDVFLTEYNKNQYNRAYRNNGSGNFTSLAIPGLTDRKGIFTSSSWADMDNDGDQDLLLTAVGNCQVFRNDAGTFTKLTSNAMALDNGYYHGACWADYDRDGKLDVFVYNYHPTRFNELYHNEGNCQFRKTTLSEFPTAAGKTTGASWTDINLDGFPDLFVPMSFEDSTRSNLLFVNQGNGTFKEQTPAAIRDQSANSVGSCWGDWDNDGDPDLLVSNASNQHNFLFRNDRNGTCTFLSSSPVSNHNGNSHGCVLADFDHNGFLDCYISNDKGQKYLYFNQQGNFTRNTTEIVTGLLGNTISSAVSDFDKDGDLDISLATHGAQKNFVFKNNGSADSWSQLKLQGTVSNKSGVGAYCRWVVNNQSYHRWHYPHQGFGSQHSQLVHAGLGQGLQIDTLEIQWPSGLRQTLYQLPVNQILYITEPEGGMLSGTIFQDDNQNCVRDPQERVLPHATLRINPGNYFTEADEEGNFQVNMPAGSYTLLPPDEHWSISCAPASTVQVSQNQTTTLVLGLIPQNEKSDLEIAMSTLAKRRGFVSETRICIKNKGNKTATGVHVQLLLPSVSYLYAANPSPTAQVAKQCTWQYNQLQAFQSECIVVQDSTGLDLPIHSEITFAASVQGYEDEFSVENNTTMLTEKIVGAIDPNDMLASPEGIGEEHYLRNDERIRYRIRFQNVGTYAASLVIIRNQLPEGLDWNTIQWEGASHPYQLRARQGNMEFRFFPIHLPDSTSNEKESHGYIEYSIKPLPNFTGKLYNQASIQFDYEEPITTNRIMHTLYAQAGAHRLLAYPNPCESEVHVRLSSFLDPELSERTIKSATLRNAQWHPVWYQQNETASEFTLRPTSLSPGIYWLEATDEFGITYRTALLVMPKP